MEEEDNVASELPSVAPGNVVPIHTTIGSVQPELYVTMRALSTLVPEGARVTVDTGLDRAQTDSGPEDDKYSPHGAPSPSLSAPVGWCLTNAEASTEICDNLPGDLTMVTSVAMELVMGRTTSGLTKVAPATEELAGSVSMEEPKFTFTDKSEIWA